MRERERERAPHLQKIIATCCSPAWPEALVLSFLLQQAFTLPLGCSSCPWGVFHRLWTAKRLHVETHAPAWILLAFVLAKGLQCAKPSSQQPRGGCEALEAMLLLAAVWWHPAVCEHAGLRVFIQQGELFLRGKSVFKGWEKELGIAVFFFLKPVRSTSYAGWFSHCVFFLSFGTNTTSLYQKEGCSCLQTWGRGRLPSAVFVVFICHFHSLVSQDKQSLHRQVICLSPYTIILGFIGKFHSNFIEALEIAMMWDFCKF